MCISHDTVRCLDSVLFNQIITFRSLTLKSYHDNCFTSCNYEDQGLKISSLSTSEQRFIWKPSILLFVQACIFLCKQRHFLSRLDVRRMMSDLPGQPFLIEIDQERVVWGHQHIQTHVKLKTCRCTIETHFKNMRYIDCV